MSDRSRRRHVGWVIGFVLAIGAAIAAAQPSAIPDGGMPDAATADGARSNAAEDAGGFGDAGLDDAGLDDAGLDDAGLDDALDAAIDAPLDAPPDAAIDAGVAELIETRSPDAPIIDQQPTATPASAQSSVFALKLIFGLSVLLALAYLGGHHRILKLQERLGIRGVFAVGFPFIALGVIASSDQVGILTDDVIPKLRPILSFGLGWIGFIVGAQLDVRILDRLPHGSAYLILVETVAPFAVTTVACGAVMIAFGLSLEDPLAWRDIVLLGAASAMTAPRIVRKLATRGWQTEHGADVLLGQLDEIAGVVGLLFIMAYFRTDASTAWSLPGTAWLFVSLGLGVVIGVLVFATIRLPRSNAEVLAVVLGSVTFAAGMAAVLRLSPLVTCFIAGVLLTNFPNQQRELVFAILDRLERPIHLLFLMIAGALWNPFDWHGWALVPLFVAARIFGRWLGVLTTRTTLTTDMPAGFTDHRQIVLPMSTMAIALVVSVERVHGASLGWIVTAVIGGAMVTELFVPRAPVETPPEPPTTPPAPKDPDEELEADVAALGVEEP